MKQDLISVIIPMYKMENFIAKCLDSVCAQSYKNLEILCVDDGSPDKSAEIAGTYAEKDPRVKIVKNPKNLGLFRARVEGMKVAKGDFIAFVDADDYISVDWFRLLHNKIVKEKADMVLGNTINVFEDGTCNYYNNYRSLTKSHSTIEKENLMEHFLSQEGSCFIWHTIWNKLYTKRLINECMPYFKKIDFRLIMGEDIAFSSVLFSHANKLAFANADGYFYYRHSQASTSTSLPLENILNNIKDLKKVFDYLETCLREYDANLYKKHYKQIVNFKDRYHRIWSGNVYSKGAQKDETALAALEFTFGKHEVILPSPHEFYFYELTTPWSNRYENIKKQIKHESTKVVSFDIFDTLISRPFYKVDDLFYFVGKYAKTIMKNITEAIFVDMRKNAESLAREKSKISNPMYEDITLFDIYQAMAEMFKLDKQTIEKIMFKEIELEVKFCGSRETGKELLEFAIACGKKVVLTSDMYLEKPIIEQILHKNGIEGFDKLFLSSDRRLLKSTGHLFDLMIKETKAAPSEIIHIGDNWNVDYVKAQSKGLKVIFLPKAIETFENKISDIYTGNGITPFAKKTLSTIDTTYALNQLPIRCMLGVVANNIFDNPFNPYQKISNFNADTYNTGFYTMGMHLFSVAKWMCDKAVRSNYKKIVFLARDGYLLKQIFDHYCKQTGVNIKTDYFYASRHSLLPYNIAEPGDLAKISDFIDIYSHTPNDILDYCSIIFNPLTEEIKSKYFNSGIILDKTFASKKEFYKFIECLKKYSFNSELCKAKRKDIEKAFNEVFTDNCATFDIGYSGRLQSIICNLAKKPVNTFFIHANGDNTSINSPYKFKIHSYYNFTPTITGIVREFMISDPSPSCTGYKLENSKIIPILENKNFAYETTYPIFEFQKGAFNFCKAFINTFKDYLKDFYIRPCDASAPFEYYLLNASEFDRYSFSASMVEDNIYGGYDEKSIFDIWTWHISHLDRNTKEVVVQVPTVVNTQETLSNYLSKHSRFKRALFYFLFDRKTFKQKLKNRRKNKKSKK